VAGPGRILAAVEERFLLPVYAGAHPERWIALHRLLSRPLHRSGQLVEWSGGLAGRTVSAACCGRTKRFRWLLSQLLDEPSPGPALGRVRTDRPSAFDRVRADVVAVEVHPATAPDFMAAGWLIVPETVRWVRGVTDLKALARGRGGRGLKSDLKQVEALGYTLEEADSPSDWKLLREQMILPFARRRFGADAWLPTPAFMRAIERGRILFAVRDGRRVSGLGVLRRGRRLWTPLIGVHGGSEELVHEGAIAALYKFVNEFARRNGIETLDMGRTRPSAAQGLAWYKAKWGFRPEPDPLAHMVALRLEPAAPELARRLAERRILLQGPEGVSPFTHPGA
jgi:hypothetical protein